ncbi:MAG TPA: ATP-binding cassette domain-containing protein [Solirubrobacteraceae bacterium]|jgi:putative ABC transport system ATP-binding protein|nr:ATP-binding cassette domain-containing protein [Solirubrobacteraceae bacterium]
MSLLELRGVGKSHIRRSRRIEVLRDVSLEVDAGELVAVWGLRRSGRSTLLAVAAGIDRPDSGAVLFEGKDLNARGATVLGDGVGYCHEGVGVASGRRVIDYVRAGLLARGVPVPLAHSRAYEALQRVGIEQFNELILGDLDGAEAVRVAIACALVLGPRVLVIDEPTKGVDLLERDEIVLLLRSLANDGMAILVSDGDGSGLSDADRALTLAGGELRGRKSPEMGTVLPLRSGKSIAS